MIFYAHSKTDELIPKLRWTNVKAFTDFLLANSTYKGLWVVSIEKEKKKRSLEQNDFMWLYLNHIEKETGNLSTDLHELFKRKFLQPVFKIIMGVEVKLPASTTNLTKSEMSDYLDKISAFTEIPIPEPIKKEFGIEVVYPVNDKQIT